MPDNFFLGLNKVESLVSLPEGSMRRMTTATLPRTFVWRRLHSLFGLWIVLFLCEHLLTNSQAALFIGDNGNGFVRMVNGIHDLPYLEAIEVFLIGVPFFFHAFLGVKYLLSGKFNSFKTDGSKPALQEYGRNQAYTWQRITSWFLLFFLIFHIGKFRFVEYPETVSQGAKDTYFVRVGMDNGLYTVANRLGVKIYDAGEIEREREALKSREAENSLVEAANNIRTNDPNPDEFDVQKGRILTAAQKYEEKRVFVEALSKHPLKQGEVIAASESFGTATLFTVRDTFKSPIYVALYTAFVLAACFHAFNGFWTFLITWGVILKMAAQKRMVNVAIGLMILVAFLGLAAVWGTYWLNLKY